MDDNCPSHIVPLAHDAITEPVIAVPLVSHTTEELEAVLEAVHEAGLTGKYVPQTPTIDNPALSDDYLFDTNDQNWILRHLENCNFVGKIKDLSKGAKKRSAKGYPQEYLFVFKYPCKLKRLDSLISNITEENIIIYIFI